MRSSVINGASLLLLSVLGIGAAQAQPSTGEPAGTRIEEMQRPLWEYRVVHREMLATSLSETPPPPPTLPDDATVQQFNAHTHGMYAWRSAVLGAYGSEGWELIAIDGDDYVFKRRNLALEREQVAKAYQALTSTYSGPARGPSEAHRSAKVQQLVEQARIQMKQGDVEEAREKLDQALFLDPDHDEARTLKSRLAPKPEPELVVPRPGASMGPGWTKKDLEAWQDLSTWEERRDWLQNRGTTRSR